VFDDVQPVIGPYNEPKIVCRELDPRTAEASRAVCGLISRHLPAIRAEHVGSTAVPGCGGRGIVDLMVTAPENELAAATELLTRLGFQPGGKSLYPPDRPPMVGAWSDSGETFLLRAYILPEGAAEIDSMRFLRSCLRSDAELTKAYVKQKKAIVKAGVADVDEYDKQKSEFLKMVLG
jgi:GrpB-like predicted nucleotidyltransferase (UPF0157 family)